MIGLVNKYGHRGCMILVWNEEKKSKSITKK